MSYPKENPLPEEWTEAGKLDETFGTVKSPPLVGNRRGVLKDLNSNEADSPVSLYPQCFNCIEEGLVSLGGGGRGIRKD